MDLNNQNRKPVRITCGNLDMRDTTEETAKSIHTITAGNVIVTPRTRPYLASFSGTFGNVIEVPENAEVTICMGNEILSHDTFSNADKRHTVINFGNMVLKPDITSEDIERGWETLINFGNITYPDHLGIIAHMTRDNRGNLSTYSSTAQLITGNMTLDTGTLQSLGDGAELAITGNLRIPDVLPDERLDQKLTRVHVMGSVLCHEENEQTLMARLDTRHGTPHMTVIPTGYELVERELRLNAASLRSWKGRHVFCTDRVIIQDDVDEDTLNQALAGLISQEMVMCPAALVHILTQKCDTLAMPVYFYEGTLWLIDNNTTLRAGRLGYAEGTVTLFVTGNLTIDPGVKAQDLHNRITGLYNWGNISGDADQIDAIEVRSVVNEGNISIAASEEADEGGPIQNQEEDDAINITVGNYKL